MTDRLDFDGDVVVVTGGAGGLGRAQCLELASRGARVVVNDLGGHPAGHGADASLAQGVVDEITALGGEAVASTDSVASDDGPQAIVAAALDTWGRLDGFVSNAAIVRNHHFEDITDADWDDVMAVDLRAVFRGLRSAYRAMRERGGRMVVMTSTSGIAGAFGQANYAAAKTGLIGLIRTIAWEGAQHGIRANLVAPGAMDTRASTAYLTEPNPAFVGRPPELTVDMAGTPTGMTADKVAPIVTRLLHRSCPVTGEIYAANGGLFHRFATVATSPTVFPGVPAAEDLVQRWDEVRNGSPHLEVDAEALVWGMRSYAEAFGSLAGTRS